MADEWIEGMDALFVNMNRYSEKVQQAALKGMMKAGWEIIADAQRNLRTAGHNGGTLNTTGQLSNSGKVQEMQDGTIDVGFFGQNDRGAYAAYVEYGTKAHWAPVDMMRQWVKKKLRVEEKDVNSVAYLVNRKIARRGTTPHPFFAPAVKKNRHKIREAANQAVVEATSK